MERQTRQIVAFYVGSRDEVAALALWDKIPEACKLFGKFYTENWKAYKNVIPNNQHKATPNKSKTNHIKRFNYALRQKCPILVRKTLSFSKSQKMHIGHIKYFICSYNLNLNVA